MVAMQQHVQSKKDQVNTYHMPQEIDHTQLCQWLVAVGKNRDKQAFTQLFKFFAPKIQRIAASKLSNDSLAHEVVQLTMTNVWKKAHLFDQTKGAVTTWIYTVMRNVTFDVLRKIQSNLEDNLSDDLWPLVENEQEDRVVFEDHFARQQLLNAIDTLPEQQQQVVKGFYLLELSQEQLAEQLDIPLGTIKSRLRLALAKLKVQLGESND
jgi:RNA polymerase sigma-70 factor (ECF subfamily)